MIVRDESAPMDVDRPCVSVTVYSGGDETRYSGSSALVAVQDESGVYCAVVGELCASDLAVLKHSSGKAADDAAEEAGFKIDYAFEGIQLLLDEMRGRFGADEAD